MLNIVFVRKRVSLKKKKKKLKIFGRDDGPYTACAYVNAIKVSSLAWFCTSLAHTCTA